MKDQPTMLLPKIILCVLTTVSLAYDYGGYGSPKSKNECKKLKHFDITPTSNGHLNRKPKFTHLEKNEKDFTFIECPNDSFMYALVAENTGSVFNIYGSNYSDTVVLSAGYKVGVVAKCDGKKVIVKTTDGKQVKIGRVACVQYSGSAVVPTVSNTAVPTSTVTSSTVTTSTVVSSTESSTTVPSTTESSSTITSSTVPSSTESSSTVTTSTVPSSTDSSSTVTSSTVPPSSTESSSTVSTTTTTPVFVPPQPDCKSCNVSSLRQSVMSGTGSVVFSETIGSCKQTTVTCQSNTKCAEVVLMGYHSFGEDLYGAGFDTTSASINLVCSHDGSSWIYFGTTHITGIGCYFTRCD